MATRIYSLDVLKVFLALMVVGLHANFLADHSQTASWLLVNGVFRVAVPVFLIGNGYFFAGIGDDRGRRKWLGRIGVLYAFWTVVYASLWPWPNVGVGWISFNVVFGWFHLWYAVALIYAALLLMFLERMGRAMLAGAAVTLFLAGVALQYFGRLDPHPDGLAHLAAREAIHRNFLFVSLPFFAAGYAMRRYELVRKIPRSVIVAMAVAGLPLLAAESWFCLRNFSGSQGVDNLLSLGLVAPALFLLCLFERPGFAPPVLRRYGKSLSLVANGIYFTHPLFLFPLHDWVGLAPTPLAVVSAVSSTALSVVLVFLYRYTRWVI